MDQNLEQILREGQKVKKYLLLAVAILTLSGCKFDSDYDQEATRRQAAAECQEYGGKSVIRWLSREVQGRPWTVKCINPVTGNEFKVYVTGVLK